MTGARPELSIADVAAALAGQAKRFDVDILDECASTNVEAMRRAEAGAPSGSVVAAKRQTAGRGRMGRTWFSEPGASLTFSLLWRFPPKTLPHGLSLAVGVALVEALEALGVGGLALKWPNDVLRDGRKLAGVLVELVPGAPHAAVIGIGLNLRLPADMPAEVRDTAAPLGVDLPPAELLARVLESLLQVLETFGSSGFVALRERWLARCAHRDRMVTILSEFAPPLTGRCVAVDVDGALMIETPVCVQRVLSGEVSLRTAP